MLPDLPFLPSYLLEILIDSVVLVSIGIVVASIAAESGLLQRMGSVAAPLCRVSGLSEPAMVSVMTMFVNATAGKAMFAGLYRKGEIGREEVIPSLVMGTFPVVLGESILRVHLPTAVLLMGPVVGGLHVLLNLFATLVQVTAAVIYTRVFLRKGGGGSKMASSALERPSPLRLDRNTLANGIRRAANDIRRIVPVTVIAILLFSFLAGIGAVEALRYLFDPLLGLIGLPGESSAALVAQFIRSYAGYAIVASLMGAGILSLKQALLTLIVGSMLVITLIYLRYTLPINLSLFGRYGIRVTAFTYAASMTAKVITIVMVFLLF